MFEDFRLFPEGASEYAGRVDALYFFLIGVAVLFVGLISALLIFLSLRYRRRKGHRAAVGKTVTSLEITWTLIPLVIVLVVFGWSTKLYFELIQPPADAMEFLVTGKQWMWKIQHPTGQREINTLHVPKGENILLTMTSEDVIHSFYMPAFRVKRDVVPGLYSSVWFKADRVGKFHLFCAEYCGTEHSVMGGWVVVQEPDEYERWLEGTPAGGTPVEQGERLFSSLRCSSCHEAGPGQRGPSLIGRFGGLAVVDDGLTLPFDEAYVRESILKPRARIAVGFEPLMPTYQGQVDEGQILQIIAYLKSLAEPPPAEPPPAEETPDEGESR